MKVLVTYLERNQVFSLSEKGTKGYLEDLKSQVSSYFKIADNRIIIIQKFDNDWECFIDLDDDIDLQDRDKLKVVLATDDYCSLTATTQPDEVPAAVEGSYRQEDQDSELEDSNDSENEITSNLVNPNDTIDEDHSEEVPPHKKVKTSSEDMNKPSTSTKYVLKVLPKAIHKTKDQESPLPNPFELPKNFRPDVAAALETRQMNRETTTAFISTVASSIFRYKKYPTTEELTDVARSIVEKYPFMKGKKKPYTSLVQELRGRMKERRRTKKERSTIQTPTTIKKEAPKKPVVSQNLVAVPAGEDITSFERHNRLLAIEYSKSKSNVGNVKELMKISFAMRRNDILENGHNFNIAQKYPFLQHSEHILEEMKGILSNSKADIEAKSKWQHYIPRIIKQALLEKGMHIEQKIKEIKILDQDGNNPMIATALLPYLVPDPRSKPDLEKIIKLLLGSDISTMLSNCPPHPIVIVTGDYKNPKEAFLVCEKKILCEISIKEIPIHLLAIFYAYNMCYPKGCINFYTFIESAILNIDVKVMPPSVESFIIRLDALQLDDN